LNNPYKDLPKNRFWKSGVVLSDTFIHEDFFIPKWAIEKNMKIATAGSCFAQHISARLTNAGFNIVDYEPAPDHIPENQHKKNGYSLYSCRYGNIYTSRQLLQLARESFGLINFTEKPETIVWNCDGRYFDALRPSVEPLGYKDPFAVLDARREHLQCVRRMFEEIDLLIFTLGLTETWMDDISGTVYPTAPGVICEPNELAVSFKNLNFRDVYEDLENLTQLLNTKRKSPIRILLTVSPVPLTGTGSGQHVLVANTYSKATLRSVASDISKSIYEFDYFPSFEIITNPALRGVYYEENLRSVRDEGVESVMRHFFDAYGISKKGDQYTPNVDEQCEEALLEAFSPVAESRISNVEYIQVFGDSHLAAFLGTYEELQNKLGATSLMSARFTPLNWADINWWDFEVHKSFSAFRVKPEYEDRIRHFVNPSFNNGGRVLCLVGLDLLGNGIINLHGPMQAGWVNPDGTYPLGTNLSPKIPHVGSFEEADAIIGQALCKQLLAKKNFIESVLISGEWDKVCWICSPIMTQKTAMYRLGEDYVLSGSQVYYNQVADAHFERIFSNCSKDIMMVPHSQNTEFGFSDNCFSPNDFPYDTHVSPNYFTEIVSLLFDPGI
jgi:hypothetical protein